MSEAATPTFTILLPIVRPPAMLPFAVRSVLSQERRDFELFIVCDGAPAETVACAQGFAAEDPRVRVFVHPKGEHHGEAYRHQALQHARGRYVCQIGDDDLWLPHHLTEMAKLLETVDFGNISHFEIASSGAEFLLAGDLGDSWIRHRMINAERNFFGASVGGYRLAAYRALPEGWAPGPPDRPSDFNMWLKFLKAPGLRFGTRVAVTALKLGASGRREWPMEQRRQETAGWADRLLDPLERERLVQLGLRAMSRVAYHMEARSEDEKQRADTLAEHLARAIEDQRQASDAAIRALAERDALAVRLNDTEGRIAALRAQLAAREHQVTIWRTHSKDMKRSWSWRLTRPFRRLAHFFAGNRAR